MFTKNYLALIQIQSDNLLSNLNIKTKSFFFEKGFTIKLQKRKENITSHKALFAELVPNLNT